VTRVDHFNRSSVHVLKEGVVDVLYHLYLVVDLPRARVLDPGPGGPANPAENEDVTHDGLEEASLDPGERKMTTKGGDEEDALESQYFQSLPPCASVVVVDQVRDE